MIVKSTRAAVLGIAEAVAERFEDCADALAKRDQKIEKVELVELAAEVARVRLAHAQADVDRDRERRSSDWTPLPSRRAVN